MPALHRHFAVLEQHPYGSILHLALYGIAGNFLADDPGTAQVMRQCLVAEEQALRRLGHDFTYAVCSPLAVPAPGHAVSAGPRRVRRATPCPPGRAVSAGPRRVRRGAPAPGHAGL